jgi:hypothetical protein
MPPKTPLTRVKEQFKDKAALVAAVEKLAGTDLWVARTNKDKGLAHVSNAKLLRLHATFTTVKEKFGTRDKLVSAVLELEKRSKDTGMLHKLSEWPVPRLWDAYRAATKRSGASAPKSPAAGAPKKSAPKAAKPAPGKSDKAKKKTA